MTDTGDNREDPRNESDGTRDPDSPVNSNEPRKANDVDLDPKDNVDTSTGSNLGTSSDTNVDTFSSANLDQSRDRNVDTRLENQMQTSHDSDDCDRSSDTSISYGIDEPDLLASVLKNTINQNLINRLLGCAYGQALGDAYGLSTEFENREDVKYNYPDQSKLIPFPDYVLTGHSRRWTRGDWTDDTDQWILVLETLTEHNGDVKVFAEKLSNWIRHGYPELGDHGGMGLGANVSQVVHSHGYLTDPLKASKNVWERGNRQAAPNGAVMRCSASAFVHFNDLEKVKSTAELMCKTTHFDPRCIASCLAVCLTIAYLLREESTDNNIEALIERVQKETIDILGDSFSEEHRKLFLWHTDQARTLEELNLDEPSAIGYTYKCLASGFYGLRSTRSFQETLNDLIRYGGDADTNGAVCGTMYGARHGYKALPYKWLRAMPFKKWFDRKLIKCLKQMNLNETKLVEAN